jgi:murein endopeptidase
VRTLCLIALALAACGFAGPLASERGFSRPPTAMRWRESVVVGSPSAGRLVHGVQLPPGGPTFFTWDPLLHRRPDRAWRRWGTDDLVRLVLRLVDRYAEAHPGAPRVGIGDLSRPHGGPFGPRHASHQNGLDVDLYYPRLDRRERAPRSAADIDRRLSQALVDLFVQARVELIFVGPHTGLRGPSGVVEVLDGHDNHLHVRIYNPARGMGSALP